MKRLIRGTFSGMAILSAVLFVATCVLWVRSYFAVERIALSRLFDANSRRSCVRDSCRKSLFGRPTGQSDLYLQNTNRGRTHLSRSRSIFSGREVVWATRNHCPATQEHALI